MPVVAVADVLKLMINELNVNTIGTDGTLSPTQEKYGSGELTRLIIYADASFFRLLAQLKGHPLREGLMTFTNAIAHGGSFVSGGPYETVQAVVTGGEYAGTRLVEPWPAGMMAELEIENRNPQPLTLIEPHAIIDGSTIYHNRAGLILAGASAVSFNVRHPRVYTDTGAAQSPAEGARAIALLALAMAQPKDGVRVDAAQHWRGMANDELQSLGMRPDAS